MVKFGDIIQIIENNHLWFACLLVVNEVQDFGVWAFIFVPDNDTIIETHTFLEFHEFKIVGEAVFIHVVSSNIRVRLDGLLPEREGVK